MKRAKDLLSVFKPHLDQLISCADNPNVFVSGSVALQLMGFRIRREPEDLDIAIYQPTKKQLGLLSMFDVVFDRRVTTFKVGDLLVVRNGERLPRIPFQSVVEVSSVSADGIAVLSVGGQTSVHNYRNFALARWADYSEHLLKGFAHISDAAKHKYLNNNIGPDEGYFVTDGAEFDTDTVYAATKTGFKVNFIAKSGEIPIVSLHADEYPVQHVSNIFDAKLAYWREKDRDDIAFVIHHNLTKL